MKLAIVGYGKMGKEVEKAALNRGHEIVAKLGRTDSISSESINHAQVVIEFTRPDAVVANLLDCFSTGIPVVTGTTGWADSLDKIEKACGDQNGALLYASNFSIGVNLFFEINRRAAQIMNGISEYDVSMDETHHTEKLDSPSGTAITLAEGIIAETNKWDHWTEQAHVSTGLQIRSHREAGVTGTHSITYASEIDQITLEHKAHNRKGFALGAVIAAEWIVNKQGVFTMQDLIKT